MKEQWEHCRIEVPAGVAMNRRNGEPRTYHTPLRFKAKRRMDATGKPMDDVWEFQWLSKPYTVAQSEVTIVE
jgi:electron transfer flavoprotein alpha/beta subunit